MLLVLPFLLAALTHTVRADCASSDDLDLPSFCTGDSQAEMTCISPSNPITVEALATVANVSAALCENSLDALQQMRCPKNPSEFTAARCRAEASRVTSNAVLCGGAEQCDEDVHCARYQMCYGECVLCHEDEDQCGFGLFALDRSEWDTELVAGSVWDEAFDGSPATIGLEVEDGDEVVRVSDSGRSCVSFIGGYYRSPDDGAAGLAASGWLLAMCILVTFFLPAYSASPFDSHGASDDMQIEFEEGPDRGIPGVDGKLTDAERSKQVRAFIEAEERRILNDVMVSESHGPRDATPHAAYTADHFLTILHADGEHDDPSIIREYYDGAAKRYRQNFFPTESAPEPFVHIVLAKREYFRDTFTEPRCIKHRREVDEFEIELPRAADYKGVTIVADEHVHLWTSRDKLQIVKYYENEQGHPVQIIKARHGESTVVNSYFMFDPSPPDARHFQLPSDTECMTPEEADASERRRAYWHGLAGSTWEKKLFHDEL